MALNGNDLVITSSDGESHGYVFAQDKAQGEPIVHTKTSPTVPLNIGSATPAQAGGQYDVRDAEGDKAITHLDWTLGAGQKSLDADSATPYMFWDSSSIDISQPGEVSLGRDTVYSPLTYSKGPVFSALGYFWLGCSADGGTLKYSLDGVTWATAAITASPSITGLINTFATDGSNLYFGVASGANKGIWKSAFNGSSFTFAKFGTTPGSEEVWGLAFNGGQMFAAVITTGGTPASRVAQVDIATGVISPQVAGSAKSTPVMFNTVTHVALVAAGNSVYWVVSQGNQSYIYKIVYDPDTKAMTTEQYAEMPSGFIATSSTGYLSTIYVAGFWASTIASVGRGAIYVAADGYSAPLLELGKQPEDTDTPSDILNDNRIYSLCSAGKDLYFVTNRGCYRWDIDDGGYSHVFDLHSGGAGETEVSWTEGSEYSWDGSDLTNADPVHAFFPSKWTHVDTNVTDPAVKTFIKTTGGLARGADTDAYCYLNPPSWSCSFPPGGGFVIGGLYDLTAITAIKLWNVTTTPLSSSPSSYDGGTFNVVITPNDPRIAGEGLDSPYKCVFTGKRWTAANIAQKATTRFNYGWPTVVADVTRYATWSFANGIASINGGTGVKTVFTTVPDGADVLVNTAGATFEIKVPDGHSGTCDITMVNNAVMAKARILKVQVPGTYTYTDAIDIPVWGPLYYNYTKTTPPITRTGSDVVQWLKMYTGGYGWSSDNNGTVTGYNIGYESQWDMFSGITYTETQIPFTATLLVDGPAARINVGGERTLRMVLKNSMLTASVNGDAATAVNNYSLKAYTGGNYIEVSAGSGTSIDYWKLNAQDAVPSQNEVEVLQYAGIAYNKGTLISPYSVPSAVAVNPIVTSSLANPCVISCTNDHGWATNDIVIIANNSRAGVNGEWTITSTGAKTFTIPYNNAVAGTGGSVYKKGAEPDGVARTTSTRITSGWLTQSETSFHTGSMMKDYRFVEVVHSVLPVGSSLEATAWVDDEPFVLIGQTTGKRTRFPLNQRGTSIRTRLGLTRGAGVSESPTIRAINVVWDFVKTKQHSYVLNCAAGAGGGRWNEDPQAAIDYLFSVADSRAYFEDAFRPDGYYGAVKEVQFLQANKSLDEGYSGILKIVIREEA